MSVAERKTALLNWLCASHLTPEGELNSIGGDAGFRCYYRFWHQGHSYMAVDAPPATENSGQFIALAGWLTQAKVRVPHIYQTDEKQGFLAIEDCGDQMLFDRLTESNFQDEYQPALEMLLQLQQQPRPTTPQIVSFDAAFIARELTIFKEWLVEAHLGIDGAELESCGWVAFIDWLTVKVMSQPYGPMHRDFHSRNLMCFADELVTIDFQDMVWGPATYDLVSLLKDCYRIWPNSVTKPMVKRFLQRSPLLANIASDQAWQAYQLTGLQRHLKIAGIFARLHRRDGKSGYLADIPATLNYVQEVLVQYPQWIKLYDFIENKVIRGVNNAT